jgi:hypothetical protein
MEGEAYSEGILSISDIHNDLIEISAALSPGKNLNLEGFPQYIGPSNAFFSFSGKF